MRTLGFILIGIGALLAFAGAMQPMWAPGRDKLGIALCVGGPLLFGPGGYLVVATN